MNFANGTGGKFENGGGRRKNDRLLMETMFFFLGDMVIYQWNMGKHCGLKGIHENCGKKMAVLMENSMKHGGGNSSDVNLFQFGW